MPLPQRPSSSSSDSQNGSGTDTGSGGPAKKRKIELDPIDHSLDLQLEPPLPAPPMDETLDSFALEFGDIDEALETAVDPVVNTTAGKDKDDNENEGKSKREDLLSEPPPVMEEPSSPLSPRVDPQLTVQEILRTYSKSRLERIRKQYVRDAWTEYKEETDRVVMQLPAEITDNFGQVGYGKFGKKWFPMLLICPYDIAFETALEGRVKFAHLGHWLGETTYSVTGPSNFVAHDKATAIHKKAVETAKRKVANAESKRPSSEDFYLVKAAKEMEALLALTPEERRKRVPHTEHPFEKTTIRETLEDMIERNISVEAFENDISDDEGLDEMSDIVDDDDEEMMDDTAPTRIRILPSDDSSDDEVAPKPKKGKKSTAQSKRTKAKPAAAKTKKTTGMQKSEVEASGPEGVGQDDRLPKQTGQMLSRASDSSEADFVNEDIPSDDDKDDDDYETDGEADHKNSIADLGIVAELGDSKTKKRKKPSAKGAKTSSKRPRMPLNERNDKQKREWMYATFKNNEKNMVPLLERLHKIDGNTETKDINKLLSELDSSIESMCWVFVEVHKVPSLLKPAKKELKSRNEDISILSKLKNKMKERYEKNKGDCNMAFSYTPVVTSYLGEDVQRRTLNQQPDGSSRKRSSKAPKADARPTKRPSVGASLKREKDVKKSERVDERGSFDKMPKPRHSTGSLTSFEKQAKKEHAQGERPQMADAERVESADKPPSKPTTLSRSGSVEKNLGDGSTKMNSAGRKSPAKPKPKFSLAGLMKPSTQEKDKTTVTAVPPKVPQQSVVKVEKELPGWMRSDSQRLALTRNRLFGLEFYKEMVENFPAEKINRESMAVELEKATFQWAEENAKKTAAEANLEQQTEDMYWRKIRAIVTVVCGKHSPGSLLQDILKGKFAEPKDLINLSDQNLMQQYFKADGGSF